MAEERFGDYLARVGVVDRAELEEIAEVQVIYGGRLGTLLLESGCFDRDTLEQHLAEFLGVPVAPPEELEKPDPHAISSLRRVEAGEAMAVPFRLDDEGLHVALVEPRDSARLGQLEAWARRRVVPYVGSEARIVELLERHYGHVCASRSLALDPDDVTPLQRPDRRDPDAPRDRRHAAPPPPPPASAEKELYFELPEGELSEAPELSAAPPEPATGEHSAPLTPEQPTPAGETRVPAARAAAPADPESVGGVVDVLHTLVALEDAIECARNRDELVQAVLGAARHFTRAVAILVVTEEAVTGLRVTADSGIESCTGVSVPRSVSCGLVEAATRSEPLHDRAPTQGVDALALQALRRGQPDEWLLVPIRVEGQVVNLLYADAGRDPIPSSVVGALRSLADQMSQRYAELIRERRETYRRNAG